MMASDTAAFDLDDHFQIVAWVSNSIEMSGLEPGSYFFFFFLVHLFPFTSVQFQIKSCAAQMQPNT